MMGFGLPQPPCTTSSPWAREHLLGLPSLTVAYGGKEDPRPLKGDCLWAALPTCPEHQPESPLKQDPPGEDRLMPEETYASFLPRSPARLLFLPVFLLRIPCTSWACIVTFKEKSAS